MSRRLLSCFRVDNFGVMAPCRIPSKSSLVRCDAKTRDGRPLACIQGHPPALGGWNRCGQVACLRSSQERSDPTGVTRGVGHFSVLDAPADGRHVRTPRFRFALSRRSWPLHPMCSAPGADAARVTSMNTVVLSDWACTMLAPRTQISMPWGHSAVAHRRRQQ